METIRDTRLDAALALAGRVLIAVLFVPDGIAKIPHFAAVAGAIATKGLPLPALLAAATIALELGGGLALLAGFKTRYVAIALMLFTLIAAFFFHDFWAVPSEQAMVQRMAFFKNVGIAGGLLVLAAMGPGRFSLQARPVVA